MPEYINPNTYSVFLIGQNGMQVTVRAKQKVVLDEYFDKYVGRGYIRRVNEARATPQVAKPAARLPRTGKIRSKLQLNKSTKKAAAPPPPTPPSPPQTKKAGRQRVDKAKKIVRSRQVQRQNVSPTGRTRVVGRRINADANALLRTNLDKSTIPISNNIGVGILSYNRLPCLRRLVDSILANTDVHKTTIFISDDGSTNPQLLEYLDQLTTQGGIVVIKNRERIGIAGNHNRLIRCLSRFKYGLMLNDDIEILQQGWEYFYVAAMQRTGMHHFMYRQEGVYGAGRGTPTKVKDMDLLVVHERPHGAVLAFDRDMLTTCGYFNEEYGFYGMEHVDWSQRVWEFSLQQPGFWDVAGSDAYFHLHSDTSVIDHKSDHLRNAKDLFKKRTPTRCGPTELSRMPEVTYVVPFRNIGREACIRTVINNIRAQQYPVIHTVLVEQDAATKIDLEELKPIYYYLVPDKRTELFNKSLAFNYGVSRALTDKIILHDADMLVQGNYTTNVANILENHDGCHMGKTVLYADQPSTDLICESKEVTKNVNCERIVGYFEGGSLGCRRSTYWAVGGFCEDYWGYGCEDCDFYARLSLGCDWVESRVFDFLHMWHGRVAHWNDHHRQNKEREAKLCKLAIPDRIKLQKQRLYECGWQEELQKWVR